MITISRQPLGALQREIFNGTYPPQHTKKKKKTLLREHNRSNCKGWWWCEVDAHDRYCGEYLATYPPTSCTQFSCSSTIINRKKPTMPFPHEAHISTAAQQFRNAISIHVIIISGLLYQPIHSGCAVVPGKSKGNDFFSFWKWCAKRTHLPEPGNGTFCRSRLKVRRQQWYRCGVT